MKLHQWTIRTVAASCVAITLAACGGHDHHDDNNHGMTPQFRSTILVSDGSVASANIDANLKNGWGIAFNPTGPVWVSDNDTKKSTLYDGNGVPQALVVTIPPNAAGQAAGPTGIVFNPSTDFQISANGGAASNALFIFATDAGTIAAWSPKVLQTQAVTAHDDGAGGAVYKGLAIGMNAGANLLYAADFQTRRSMCSTSPSTRSNWPAASSIRTCPQVCHRSASRTLRAPSTLPMPCSGRMVIRR